MGDAGQVAELAAVARPSSSLLLEPRVPDPDPLRRHADQFLELLPRGPPRPLHRRLVPSVHPSMYAV